MTDLVIELKIQNPSDWDIIQPLLQRLKISFTKKEMRSDNQDAVDTELQELQAMRVAGVDSSYYVDPVAYPKADVLTLIQRPIQKRLDIEVLKKAKNYKGVNRARFNQLVKEINIEEPVDVLLSQLSR